MTAPDDMIEVPRRDLEALVLPASSKSHLAKYHDELREMADATVRVRRLLEPPTCGAVLFLDVPEHPHHPGVPSHPHFLAKAPCVLPSGHHTPRRSNVGFDCITCTASADDPIHAGDVHQVDPALWVEPS